MQVRILDLDGSILAQRGLLGRYQPSLVDISGWASDIRLTCSFRRFRQFEQVLRRLLSPDHDPSITFYGSGDFHHVSLALLRRLNHPVNLLVLDNHPDWMRCVPFMHCGTWLYHAAHLPQVHRVFHVGGDVDFDNYYLGLAPWRILRNGKITVFPSVRRFGRGPWQEVRNEPVRPASAGAVDVERFQDVLRPFGAELASRPLYISLDKDVMTADDAIVNWDSGHISLPDVQVILSTFLRMANGRLAGMDLPGDWSPVRLRGGLRRLMHWSMHPAMAVDPELASRQNERTNLALLDTVASIATARMAASA
jgi:hypothetical protein